MGFAARTHRHAPCGVTPGWPAWLTAGMWVLWGAPVVAATHSAPPLETRLVCDVVYLPTRASWVREVVLSHSGKRLKTVSIDGVQVHTFALNGSWVLTALDNERIQIDLSQPAWTSDFRGLAQGQGHCALMP